MERRDHLELESSRSTPDLEAVLERQTAASTQLRASVGRDGGALAELAPLVTLEQFLSNITRAVRNYLGPIKGYASLIQDDSADGTNTRRWADRVAHSAESLEGFIDRLAMLQVEGATDVAETSWGDIVAGAMERIRHVNPGAAIDIHIEAEAPFHQRPVLIMRALFQILRNACEAAGARGRVVLSVTERRVTGNGGIVRDFTVVVSDSGPGIDSERSSTMFQPFFTTRHDHLGLGLSYVWRVCPVIDMQVDVASPGEVGTTVTLRLQDQGGQQ